MSTTLEATVSDLELPLDPRPEWPEFESEDLKTIVEASFPIPSRLLFVRSLSCLFLVLLTHASS
jgi:hypothetical protein